MERKKWKNKNLLVAFQNSLSGIKYVIQNETSFQIECVIGIFAITFGILLKLSLTEWMTAWLAMGLVLFAELINTAIEVMLDLYSQEYNEKIKIAKDISSSAVLITVIVAIMLGCVLFLPKLGMLFFN